MSDTSEQFIYSEELYQLPARVIVLIPVPWNEMSDGEKALLTKILSAARLSVHGVQILQDKNVNLERLKIYNPTVVISFGVDLKPATNRYEPKSMDGITIIQSDELNALDDAKKKDLWTALKKLISA